MAAKAPRKTTAKKRSGIKMIPIYIMGKKYAVPETLTILTAMEHAGYRHVRGCGCRGGICGACATLYRLAGEHHLRFGLACQTVVVPDMYLVQIPFVPVNKAAYDIEKIAPDASSIGKIYPEIYRCLACNTCSKACPMGIRVMDCMQAVLKGDITACAQLSHRCTMCGICSLRCPAELPQLHIAMLARRLYGRFIQPRAKHVEKRVQQIREGKFDRMMDEIMSLSRDELKRRYHEREWEPEAYEYHNWQPKETRYLVLD